MEPGRSKVRTPPKSSPVVLGHSPNSFGQSWGEILRKTRIYTRYKVKRQSLSCHLSGPVLAVKSFFPALVARMRSTTGSLAENPGPRSLRSTGETFLTSFKGNLPLKGRVFALRMQSRDILRLAAKSLGTTSQGRNFQNSFISSIFDF